MQGACSCVRCVSLRARLGAHARLHTAAIVCSRPPPSPCIRLCFLGLRTCGAEPPRRQWQDFNPDYLYGLVLLVSLSREISPSALVVVPL